MQQPNTLFVGLDVHKDSLAVAYVPEDRSAEVPDSAELPGEHSHVTPTAAIDNGSHINAQVWSEIMASTCRFFPCHFLSNYASHVLKHHRRAVTPWP